MILGTKARYGVMAMVELAGHEGGKPVPLAELAGAQEITVPYLEQIFNKLKTAHLVQSVRGPNGGYALSKKPEDISIAEIVSAVEESVKMTRCEKREKGCMNNKSRCRTHHLWEGLEHQIERYLNAVSLADVRSGKLELPPLGAHG